MSNTSFNSLSLADRRALQIVQLQEELATARNIITGFVWPSDTDKEGSQRFQRRAARFAGCTVPEFKASESERAPGELPRAAVASLPTPTNPLDFAQPCECRNWARVDNLDDNSPHHPRCPNRPPGAPLVLPAYASFGEAVWKFIVDQGGEFCGSEISEDILPLAQAAGLCARVKYDPNIHGDLEADPGDEIWWWGETLEEGAQ